MPIRLFFNFFLLLLLGFAVWQYKKACDLSKRL